MLNDNMTCSRFHNVRTYIWYGLFYILLKIIFVFNLYIFRFPTADLIRIYFSFLLETQLVGILFFSRSGIGVQLV